MQKKIKIAQIGIGHNHGADKMLALRELPDYFEVDHVRVFDRVDLSCGE